MEHTRDKQIDAYINREMPERERKAFESELAADPELRADVQAHRIVEKVITAQGQVQVRTKIKAVRQEKGPLPAPRITFVDHFRFFYYSRLNRAIVIALLLTVILAGGWWAMQSNLCPMAKISAAYFIPPTEIHAMASPVLDYSQAQKASNFYSKGQLDSLLQLVSRATEPSVPLYYTAHQHLKTGDFQRAAEAFTAVLARRENLQEYTEYQDMGSIKFNLLLSKFGRDNNWDAALKELAALRADPDFAGEAVAVKAARLEADLNKPLLRILCFK